MDHNVERLAITWQYLTAPTDEDRRDLERRFPEIITDDVIRELRKRES